MKLTPVTTIQADSILPVYMRKVSDSQKLPNNNLTTNNAFGARVWA